MKTMLDVVGAVKTYTDNKISLDPKEITVDYSDIISITDAFPKAAKDVKLKVDAVQDLHGYDNPWVGGAGKNLLQCNFSDGSSSGMSWTTDKDDAGNVVSMTLNGTYSGSERYFLKLMACYLEAGNYYLSGAHSGYAEIFIGGDLRITNNNPIVPTAFTVSTSDAYPVFVAITQNKQLDNAKLYPMIRKAAETDASFAPYTNICPISGWDNAKVTRDGRNKQKNGVTNYSDSGIVITHNDDDSITIQVLNASTSKNISNLWTGVLGFSEAQIPTEKYYPNGTYIISAAEYGNSCYYQVARLAIGADWATMEIIANTGNGTDVTFTVEDGYYYWIRIRSGVVGTYTMKPMLRLATETDATFEPYQGKELTIDLDGTRYGGTLDVTSGVLTVDKAGFIKTEGTNIVEGIDSNADWLNVRIGIADILDTNPIRSKNTCSHCKFTFATANGEAHFYTLNDCVQLFLPKSTYPTVDSFISSLATTPFSFMGYLVTPQTIQLTPAEVKLLQGYNTLYADSGDISLTYNPATLGNVVEEVGELEDDVQDLENYVADTGVKNFCPTFPASVSVAGVAYTTASNGIVSAVGISTGQTAGFFAANQVANLLPAGDYIASAGSGASEDLRLVVLIKRANNSSVYIECTSAQDKPFTVYANDQFMSIYIRTNGGDKAINGTIAPMIRPASITDPTYQPYAKTNVELTAGLSTKLDKTNPTGTGSFSLNRKADTTVGSYSFAEGSETAATGSYSHAEGYYTTAEGNSSHAEGYGTGTIGNYSHAEGYGTIAGYDYQHVSGKCNSNKSTTLLEIGNGTDDSTRSNAFEVYSDGSLSTDNGTTKVKLEDLVKGGNKISAKPVISTRKTWLTKTWSGLTEIHGNDVWTDGDNIYYSFGSNQYVLDKATSTWSTKTWSELTSFNGYRVWTDGDNIYYSYNAKQYVLDKSTSTWSTKTWSGLTSFDGSYIWTDGDNIYYSNDSSQYVLDKSTSTWLSKTWSGLNPSRGDDTWTDGDNIYYSYNADHYVLDKSTSAWSAKTWSGLTEFHGNNVWTDGDNIYYSASTYQYVLDKATSTWNTKTWSGLTSFNGTSVWTDGDNIYNSASTYQYILCEKLKSIKPALK